MDTNSQENYVLVLEDRTAVKSDQEVGNSFNAYVRMDKEQNRPRFYKFNPDKKQTSSKVETVPEEHKTQVVVNNKGKTNEATKHLK